MLIWEYRTVVGVPQSELVHAWDCPFCASRMDLTWHPFAESSRDPLLHPSRDFNPEVRVCLSCGWWRVYDMRPSACEHHGIVGLVDGCYAHLRDFDCTDVSQPIEEVSRFLVAQYDKRFTLHPRLLEETVREVFAGLGFSARLTAYHRDGGIDVILDLGGKTIGVQVKRYRNTITVEQVRSLVGALVVGGHTTGVFVTTSSFQRGCTATAKKAAVRGYPVELVDAEGFYEMLKITRRPAYASYEDWVESVRGFPPLQHVSGYPDTPESE